MDPGSWRGQRRPDLRTIYDARMIRGQTTFQGLRRFYVDEHKEEALREELLRRGLEKRQEDRFVETFDHRFRVEIIRKGGGKIPSAMIAYARQRCKTLASDTLKKALSRAGLEGASRRV